MGDILSYYTDRAQNEAYLPTATQKSSVINIAQMLGYRPGTGSPAYGTITLMPEENAGTTWLPAGTTFVTNFIDELDGPVYYELSNDESIPGWNSDSPSASYSVSIREGRTIAGDAAGNPKVLGDSSGWPDQVFILPDVGVYNDTVEVFVNGEKWEQITNLIDAYSTDHKVEVSVNEEGQSVVRFGDNLNGLIPPKGMPVAVRYRVGVGAAGNVVAGTVTQFYTPIEGVKIKMIETGKSVSSDMIGGSDPEGIEEIRASAPKVFNSQQRAVNLEDYEAFALSVPGVAKAKAVARNFSNVTVYLVATDGNPPTDRLISSVKTLLMDRALAGVAVTVTGPSMPGVFPSTTTTDNDFISIQFGDEENKIEVEVFPQAGNQNVTDGIIAALKDLLSVNKVDLGYRVTTSEVYSTIMGVDGVRWAYVPLFFRTDGEAVGNQDIKLSPREFPVIGSVHIHATGGIG